MKVFELTIDDLNNEALNAVSLVSSPAIEKNFEAFSKKKNNLKFIKTDNEKRIVYGPAMIPELFIPRINEKDGSEFMVYFTAQTIEKIAINFFKGNRHNMANVNHEDLLQDGVTYFLSFISTEKTSEYPQGTWFLGAKIENDTIWQKVKSGEIRGFSVEGNFIKDRGIPMFSLEALADAIFSQL